MISRALSIAVVCGTLILLPSASSRAADPAAPLDLTWKDNILTISGPQLSGGPLDIRYLEAFVRSGSTKRDWGQSVIDHHTVWTSQSSDEIKNTLALRSTLANGVTVTHSVRSDVDEIDFQLAAINRTKEFADVQWAQPCVHIAKFAGPGPADANAVQPKYIRNCFIFVNGKEQRLPTEPWAKNARYTPGQVYCPAGVDRADVNPRPLSNVVPSCSLMGCYSADGKQIVAIAWDSYQEVFQGVVGCLHSDLRIGGLKPGERKKIHGKLYVVSADMDQLKRRFARDFPSQAAGVGIAAAPSSGGPVDAKGRPRIDKLGTIATHMVETTPVVFNGRLYRFEWVRENDPKKPIRDPNNKLGYDHFHFIDVATGKATEPFAIGYRFGSAFVGGDTVYVTGSGREEGWSGRHVQVFASKDLKNWQSWEAIPPPKYGICNTSVCKADGKYVLMFEIWKPVEEAGVKYTARFATSPDMKKWTITPPECVYAKDRYTAPHALRYLDGWYYDFYLEKLPEGAGYETRVVRSRDLIHWQPSPLNPVLRFSPEDKKIANEKLTIADRQEIEQARDINNSDIDFCEHDGHLVFYYTWGDQLGKEFLAEGRYNGTEAQFLRGWFPKD